MKKIALSIFVTLAALNASADGKKAFQEAQRRSPEAQALKLLESEAGIIEKQVNFSKVAIEKYLSKKSEKNITASVPDKNSYISIIKNIYLEDDYIVDLPLNENYIETEKLTCQFKVNYNQDNRMWAPYYSQRSVFNISTTFLTCFNKATNLPSYKARFWVLVLDLYPGETFKGNEEFDGLEQVGDYVLRED